MVHKSPFKFPFYDLAMVTKFPYMVRFMENKFSKESILFLAPMAVKLEYRFLKFYSQKRCFGTACRPLNFFSAKLKNFYGRCMFSKFP